MQPPPPGGLHRPRNSCGAVAHLTRERWRSARSSNKGGMFVASAKSAASSSIAAGSEEPPRASFVGPALALLPCCGVAQRTADECGDVCQPETSPQAIKEEERTRRPHGGPGAHASRPCATREVLVNVV